MSETFKERSRPRDWEHVFPEERPIREHDGANPSRYAQAPVVDFYDDDMPVDINWDSPGGFSGDPLETPKHPAYQLPTRWQGTTTEEMGF